MRQTDNLMVFCGLQFILGFMYRRGALLPVFIFSFDRASIWSKKCVKGESLCVFCKVMMSIKPMVVLTMLCKIQAKGYGNLIRVLAQWDNTTATKGEKLVAPEMIWSYQFCKARQAAVDE